MQQITFMTGDNGIHRLSLSKNAGVGSTLFFYFVMCSDDLLFDVMEKNHTEFTLIPINNGIDEALQSLDGLDAVYLGFLGKFEGPEKSDG